MSWKTGIAVFLGSAAGAVLRFAVSFWTAWPTLWVNGAGSLLLGFFTAFFMVRGGFAWLEAGLGAGFCGGFTTMSTFSEEVWRLLAAGEARRAFFVVLLMLTTGLLAASAGFFAGNRAALLRRFRHPGG